nr:hypothetical protein B0A51_11517 [Rachicladosporium sp. CCFEE 5018]
MALGNSQHAGDYARAETGSGRPQSLVGSGYYGRRSDLTAALYGRDEQDQESLDGADRTDIWRKRFRAIFQTTEPDTSVAEPASEPVSEPVPDTAVTASVGNAPAAADAWKPGWWSVSSSASAAKGRERLAAVKAAEPGVKRAEERDALKAEHERIYRFFRERYGGDNTSLPAWQKLCVDAEVENLDKIYVCIYQSRATIGAEPVENVAELVSKPVDAITIR